MILYPFHGKGSAPPCVRRSSRKGRVLAKLPNSAPKPPAEKGELSTGLEVRIEDAIERALEGKVAKRELPDVARRITQIAVSEQFSGPMPHPRHLREYEDILPGAAERILLMAEQNLLHNITTHEKVVESEIADQTRGMWLGAGLFALLIVGAFASLFVTTDAWVPALFLGTAAIGGVVAFIRGRNGR